ncbi:hypothetical protein FIBSPDRAFT_955404 [Athelia psychrophila]|uniref:Uncharacterized protein n=1 Tax=Athelia psychrophila TaxID=1759441 RepID=A0A166I441_9AGAM|nr:hypothetical protein FIBSPDRAFT_955404 [Fibularhizoctonia sp. CBS 109695]
MEGNTNRDRVRAPIRCHRSLLTLYSSSHSPPPSPAGKSAGPRNTNNTPNPKKNTTSGKATSAYQICVPTRGSERSISSYPPGNAISITSVARFPHAPALKGEPYDVGDPLGGQEYEGASRPTYPPGSGPFRSGPVPNPPARLHWGARRSTSQTKLGRVWRGQMALRDLHTGNTHIFQADRSSRHDRISEQREKEKRAMEEKEVAEQEAANANAKLEQEQEQRTWEEEVQECDPTSSSMTIGRSEAQVRRFRSSSLLLLPPPPQRISGRAGWGCSEQDPAALAVALAPPPSYCNVAGFPPHH